MQKRQAALEAMGISVDGAGIKVEVGRFYLVNLNADPSLNELLVYYINKVPPPCPRLHERRRTLLQETTIIGQPEEGGEAEPDIQVRGLGIQAHHAVLTLAGATLSIQPSLGAKTCVNGSAPLCLHSATPRRDSLWHSRVKIGVATTLKNGDRIVVGHNHFFRVNCPRKPKPRTVPPSLCVSETKGAPNLSRDGEPRAQRHRPVDAERWGEPGAAGDDDVRGVDGGVRPGRARHRLRLRKGGGRPSSTSHSRHARQA